MTDPTAAETLLALLEGKARQDGVALDTDSGVIVYFVRGVAFYIRCIKAERLFRHEALALLAAELERQVFAADRTSIYGGAGGRD